MTALLMRWWGTAWRNDLEAAFHEQQSMAAQSTPSPFLKATKS